jgi:RNA polymerase sigma-70 factor (ECF subfamily)
MRLVDDVRADGLARDHTTLQRVAQGDRAAVAELYDRYGRLVFALSVRIVGDPAVAEELVQEVFVRAWRSAASYRPELGSVRAWLLAIAHHRSIDELRRARKEQGWISLEAASPALLKSEDDHLGDPLVERALQALPAEQHAVIDLAYFQGLTVMDIATRLDLPPGTVKSRMRLALHKLRAYLGVNEG